MYRTNNEIFSAIQLKVSLQKTEIAFRSLDAKKMVSQNGVVGLIVMMIARVLMSLGPNFALD